MIQLSALLQRFFLAATLIAALLVTTVLFTGGFVVSLFGASFLFDDIALLAVCLLLLGLMYLLAQHGFRFKDAFRSNEAFIVFSLCLICYLANHKTLAAGDTFPNRYLPFSIMREGNLDFDEFQFLYKDGTPYWLQLARGHYVSYYPLGASLLSLPFFLPSAAGNVDVRGEMPAQLEKLAAASLTALSAVLLLLTLRRLVNRKMALLLTALYAFGTSSLSTSSQALWQHGPSQLCLAAAFYCIIRGRSDPRWIAPAATALAFSILCRPTNILIALPLCLYVAIHHFRRLPGFVLAGLPVALFQLWYNLTYLGTPAISQANLSASYNWQGPLAANLAGLLFSPARGLFVYSPVFLFLIPAVVQIWKKKEHLLLRYLSVGVLATLLTYGKWGAWTGGYCFGPRFFSDLCPVFVLMLTPLEPALSSSKVTRVVMIVLLGMSVTAHSVGAFFDDRYWNVYLGANEQLAWSWTDNQLVNPVRRLYVRSLVRLKRLPAAYDSPQLLSATYDSTLTDGFECKHLRVIYFNVDVANTGNAACLSWPSSRKGWTRLGWRWEKGGKDLLRTRSFIWLRNDLLPGKKQTYTLAVKAPEKPGNYVLVIELNGKDIGWFSELGIPPLRLEGVVR